LTKIGIYYTIVINFFLLFLWTALNDQSEISGESYRTSLSNLTSKMVTWYEEREKLEVLRKKNPDTVKQVNVDALSELIERMFTETVNAYVDFRLLEASNPDYSHKTDFGICSYLPESVGFDNMNSSPRTKENKVFLSLMNDCRQAGLANLIDRIAHQEGGSTAVIERINQLVHVDRDQLRKGYNELLDSAPRVNWLKNDQND
jgi:hypothetical protein